MAVLAAAVKGCRQRAGDAPAPPQTGSAPAAPDAPADLAAAVAGELAAATARLSEPQREVLALRELLGLSYADIAAVTGAEPDAVAPLLAGARLALRTELRGTGEPQATCDEHDRALRTIALRQDGQPVPEADGEWLVDHLGHCRGCGQAHAAMLEASACYRAWRSEDAPSGGASGSARALARS